MLWPVLIASWTARTDACGPGMRGCSVQFSWRPAPLSGTDSEVRAQWQRDSSCHSGHVW
jgi:hypothetical protein